MSTSVEETSTPGTAFGRVAAIAAAGLVCGFLSIVLSIGAGSLVFAANLTSFLPYSLGLALFSASVTAAIVSVSSSTKSAIVAVQEVPCVALGVLVGATAQHISADVSDADAFTTVMVAVGAGTFSTGLGVLLIGACRLGELIRFIPYPVIGGFLAGTGWLIFLGGLGIVLAAPATTELFTSLPDADAITRLALAFAFIFVLVLARRRSSSPLVLPGVLLGGLILFNIALQITAVPHDVLEETGWFFAFPGNAAMWPAIGIADLANIEWRPVALGLLYAPLIVVLTAVNLLLNATGIEMEHGDDIDLNRELRSVGAGNAIVGLGGGLPGFHSLSLTLIASRLGANSRWVGITTAAILFTALVFGPIVLDIIPPFILGAMLIWMGGSLLIEWAIKSFRRIAIWDYALIILILVIVIVVGFGVGIAAGFVAAVILFVVQYGRIDAVRNELTGRQYQSRVEGSPRRQEVLQQHGDTILIFRLQGYLFFGTANRLRRRLQDRLSQGIAGSGGFLVLDFHRVTGMDSSAVSSFAHLQQITTKHGAAIVLTGLSDTLRSSFRHGDLDISNAPSIRVEPDLERGLKWCEDALLAKHADDGIFDETREIGSMLADIVGDVETSEIIRGYFERVVAEAGTELAEENTLADDIYFIESGRASVAVTGDATEAVHLATVTSGAIIGEIAFYLADRRSASVIAESDMVVWRLSRAAMGKLQAEAPDIALRFHEGMAAVLARRLMHTNRLVSFLSE